MTLRYTCPADNPKSTETPVVFVVDGDQSVRDALDVRIRSAGYQPRTSASAEEFLARPRVMAPCCLLVELHLPGLSGLGLQRLLFERTELPIIFMSEHIDVPATVEAMRGGALEFLTKPLVRDVLLTAIREGAPSQDDAKDAGALRHRAPDDECEPARAYAGDSGGCPRAC